MMERVVKYFTFFSLITPVVGSQSESTMKKESISPQELITWETLDKGKSSISNEELMVEETEGADGYFLISPKSYHGDLVINYKVKALSKSSVLIVLFSASDQGISGVSTLDVTKIISP